MNRIQLSTGFLKNGFRVLLVIFTVTEVLSWSIASDAKAMQVNRSGGLLPYGSLLITNLILPELMTILVLTKLMEWFRRWFNITTVGTNWLSLARYEFSFLPVLALSFLFFFPLSGAVRYLLTEFPDYSFSDYWNNYLLSGFSWRMYSLYLVPILLVGYCTLNSSLLHDYRKQSKFFAEN